MNLVVFGEDIFTATAINSLIANGHRIKLIVSPFYENNWYKTLEEIANKHDILFLREKDVNSLIVENEIKSLNPDLLVSVHLRKILHKQIFSIPQRGAINVHPSLLPKYRGLSPQHQAIIHGDSISGVTIHFIEEDVDTGNIIIQERFSIEQSDYIFDVQLKVLKIYQTIFVKALELLSEDNYSGELQRSDNVSYFGPIKKVDRLIDLNKPKNVIFNLIRALSKPYKGAFIDNITFWRAIIPDPKQEEILIKKYPDPGAYRDDQDNSFIIRVIDGVLISEDFEYINIEI